MVASMPLNVDRALDQIIENSPHRFGITPNRAANSRAPAPAHPRHSVTSADHTGRVLAEVREIPRRQDEHDSAGDLQMSESTGWEQVSCPERFLPQPVASGWFNVQSAPTSNQRIEVDSSREAEFERCRWANATAPLPESRDKDMEDAPAAAPPPGSAMIHGWTYPFQPGSSTGHNAIPEESTAFGSDMEWQREMTVEVTAPSTVGTSWQPQQMHSTQLAQDGEMYKAMSICSSDSRDAMSICDSNSCEAMSLCESDAEGPLENEPESELASFKTSLANFLNHSNDPVAIAGQQSSSLDASPNSRRWAFVLEEMVAQDAISYKLVGRDERATLCRFKLEGLVLRRSEGSMRPSDAYIEARKTLDWKEALRAQALQKQPGHMKVKARLREQPAHQEIEEDVRSERELQQSKMEALMATAKQRALRALDSRRGASPEDRTRSDRSARALTGRVERSRVPQGQSRLGRHVGQDTREQHGSDRHHRGKQDHHHSKRDRH